MAQIFIGYRRDDGGHAWSIYQHLSLWFDEKDVFIDHEGLDSGQSFKPALTATIEGSKVFLAVIGPHWLSENNRTRLDDPDDITRGEIRTAVQKGIPIIPVTCSGATVPNPKELPADMAPFCGGHHHPIPDSEHFAALNRLIDQLRDTYKLKPRYRHPQGVRQAHHLGDQKLSPYFSDPADALGRLRRMLTEQGEAAVVGQATLQGMGGVGKTQLAIKYCTDFKDVYAGVWWFKAESLLQLQQDFQQFCAQNGEAIGEGEEPHSAVARFLRRQPRWLLVFDNAEPEYGEKKEHLRPYLPAGDHHIIVTARSPQLGDAVASLPLDIWSEEEALPFLRQRLPGRDEKELRRLCKTLGGLPLALEQACAYLLKTGTGVDAYCKAFGDLTRSRKYLEAKDSQQTDYPLSVYSTLSLAFDKLSPAAQALLRLCAWCAPEPIIDSLFRSPAMIMAASEEGKIELDKETKERLRKLLPDALHEAASDDLLWGETVADLTGFALARRVEVDITPSGMKEPVGDRALLIHRLTQAVVINQLSDAAVDVPMLTELLCQAYPDDLSSIAGWPLARALASHVLRLDDHFSAGHISRFPPFWLLGNVGMYLYYSQALYRQSAEIFQRNLARSKEIHGLDHHDTLSSMSSLALTLWKMGNFLEAKRHQEYVLTRREVLLGPDDPDTLISMANLASTLKTMGDYARAMTLEEHVLARSEELLGTYHPETLGIMHNLGGTLSDMGDHSRAKVLEEFVLAHRKEILGQKHPDTLTTMHNLAGTLWKMGDNAEAKWLQEHVLTHRKEILGPDHPDTLTSMNNLSLTLGTMGDHAGAKVLQEHVWERMKEVLGPDHLDTLTSMNNLALTLWKMNDYEGAIALWQEALKLTREKFGSRYPLTSVTAWGLFTAVYEQGERKLSQSVLDDYLLWLLSDKVELESADQRKIRGYLRMYVRPPEEGG